MKVSYEEKVELKTNSLKTMIKDFGMQYLKDDITQLCINLVDLMAEQDHVMYMQGKLKNWASAIIYIIADNNYIFENLLFETLDHEDIEEFFNSKHVFYVQLASRINKLNVRSNNDFIIREGIIDVSDHMYVDKNGEFCLIDELGFVIPFFPSDSKK